MQINDIMSSQITDQYAAVQQSSRAAVTDGQDATAFATEFAKAADKLKSEKNDKKLKQACEDFESMFLNLMYSKMRDTVTDDEDGLFKKSNGEKIMQSMLDTELTKNMAKAGGIGLAKMIYEQVSREQAGRTDNPTAVDKQG